MLTNVGKHGDGEIVPSVLLKNFSQTCTATYIFVCNVSHQIYATNVYFFTTYLSNVGHVLNVSTVEYITITGTMLG